MNGPLGSIMLSVPLPFKEKWSIWQEIIQIEDGLSVNKVVAFFKIGESVLTLDLSAL